MTVLHLTYVLQTAYSSAALLVTKATYMAVLIKSKLYNFLDDNTISIKVKNTVDSLKTLNQKPQNLESMFEPDSAAKRRK